MDWTDRGMMDIQKDRGMMDIQKNRQTDRQTGRQAGRQADRQTCFISITKANQHSQTLKLYGYGSNASNDEYHPQNNLLPSHTIMLSTSLK